MKHGPIRCGTAAAGGAKGDDPRSATGTARLPLPAASPAVVGKAANPLRRGGEEPPRETAGCRRELAGDAARTRQAAQSERPKGNASGPKENGAGIAADPTLTDAWSRRNGRLASGGFPLSHRSARSGPSPALAPASGNTLLSSRPTARGRTPSQTGRENPRQAFPRPDFPGGRRLEHRCRFGPKSSAPPPRASDRSIRPVGKRLAPVRHRTPGAADRSPCIRLSQNRRGQVSPRLPG